jgi:hypothetical protein
VEEGQTAVFVLMRRFWAILLLCSSTAPLDAQSLGVGVKGGVRLLDDLDSYWAISESKRYVVGAMATIGFGPGFSVEVDALFRRAGYRTRNSDLLGGSSTARARGNSWELPILLRKTLGHGLYGAAGCAPRLIHGAEHVDIWQSGPDIRKDHIEFDLPGTWDTTYGLVAGGGLTRRVGPVRVAPEVRYVYWNKPAIEEYGSRGFSIVSNQHQVDVLIGITWR